MTEHRKKCVIAVTLLLMFLFGMHFVREAGVYFDEASEQRILYNNILQYSETFHVEKLAGWFRGRGAIPICEDIEMDHGIAPYYLSVPFLILTDGRANMQSLVWHIYTYLLFFCGVIAMYRLVYEIFHSRITALTGAMLLFFSPRIFADGLYNNKDTVLLSMVIIMLLYGVRFFDRRDTKSAVMLGIVAGIACNLKVSGIYVFALIGGYYIVMLSFRKQWNRQRFLAGVIAAVTGFLSYLILTPAIWGQGFHLIRFLEWNLSNTVNFSRIDGTVLFEGELYKHSVNPLPWYYLPKIIALTIPIHVLGLILASVILWLIRCRKCGRAEQLYPLFAVIPIMPLVVAMMSQPNLYNGWRHFYFIYGPMICMAVYTVHWLFYNIRYRRAAEGIMILLIMTDIVGIAKYGIGSVAYTSLLAGGDAQGRYEMDYYGVTSAKIMKSLVDRYGTIALSSDANGAVIVNWQALSPEYQERIRLLYSEDDIRAAVERGEKALGFVNTSYDVLDDTGVNWLEEWTAWGNTYVKIRQYE